MHDDLIEWQTDTARHCGARPLQLAHGLHKSPLFSQPALARLIEGAKRENYYVNTMDVTAHNVRSRREGAIVPGAGVLKAQVPSAATFGRVNNQPTYAAPAQAQATPAAMNPVQQLLSGSGGGGGAMSAATVAPAPTVARTGPASKQTYTEDAPALGSNIRKTYSADSPNPTGQSNVETADMRGLNSGGLGGSPIGGNAGGR